MARMADPPTRERAGFAHDATLGMDVSADIRAPGAAITVALCGHWEHEPPCSLAPHHTGAERHGDEVRLRVLFATELASEQEVRARIARALEGGELVSADGGATRWTLSEHGASTLRPDEQAHAARLMTS